MAWYYFTGNTIRPIPVAKGRSVAVRPHTKFEVFDETLKEVQDLAGRGIIRKCGKPLDAKPGKAEPVEKIDPKHVQPPIFARSVAEKGVTSAKGIPPKSIRPVEMTEHEAHSAAIADEGEGDRGKGKKSKETGGK